MDDPIKCGNRSTTKLRLPLRCVHIKTRLLHIVLRYALFWLPICANVAKVAAIVGNKFGKGFKQHYHYHHRHQHHHHHHHHIWMVLVLVTTGFMWQQLLPDIDGISCLQHVWISFEIYWGKRGEFLPLPLLHDKRMVLDLKSTKTNYKWVQRSVTVSRCVCECVINS